MTSSCDDWESVTSTANRQISGSWFTMSSTIFNEVSSLTKGIPVNKLKVIPSR